MRIGSVRLARLIALWLYVGMAGDALEQAGALLWWQSFAVIAGFWVTYVLAGCAGRMAWYWVEESQGRRLP